MNNETGERLPFVLEGLNSQAKIILVLMTRPQLTKEELLKLVSRATFYRARNLLLRNGVLRMKDDKYVLFDFTDLEEVFQKLKHKRDEEHAFIKEVSLDFLAHEVGKPPSEIEKEAYWLAYKYDFKIGPDMRTGRSLKHAFRNSDK